jgi:hypothetical protein
MVDLGGVWATSATHDQRGESGQRERER